MLDSDCCVPTSTHNSVYRRYEILVNVFVREYRIQLPLLRTVELVSEVRVFRVGLADNSWFFVPRLSWAPFAVN